MPYAGNVEHASNNIGKKYLLGPEVGGSLKGQKVTWYPLRDRE